MTYLVEVFEGVLSWGAALRVFWETMVSLGCSRGKEGAVQQWHAALFQPPYSFPVVVQQGVIRLHPLAVAL